MKTQLCRRFFGCLLLRSEVLVAAGVLNAMLVFGTTVANAADPFQILHVCDTCYTPSSLCLSGTVLYGVGIWSANAGSVFRLNCDGSGYQVLKTFSEMPDGSFPDGRYPRSLMISGTTLYGTTSLGGSFGSGTVFRMSTEGDFTLLHSFDETNGRAPNGTLALSGSYLYGGTSWGGASHGGVVFRLNVETRVYTVLKELGSPASVASGIVMLGSTLYGTCGAFSDTSAVFKLDTTDNSFAILKTLTRSVEGAQPGPLIGSGTTLYGVAKAGGAFDKGTVFRLNTDGTGFAVLRHFTGSAADGNTPCSLLLSGNRLYGSSIGDGLFDYGSLFLLNTDGTGFTLLRQFPGPYSIYPNLWTLSGTTLYGTAYSAGLGEVFSFTLSAPDLVQPGSQTAEIGTDVVLSARVTGVPPPELTWRFSSAPPCQSGTNCILVLTNVQPSYSGSYTVVASNSLGACTSAPTMLSLIAPVERRIVPRLLINAQPGALVNLEYSDALPAVQWTGLGEISMTVPSQSWLDTTTPVSLQRFYRTRQATANPATTLEATLVPALSLSGAVGTSVRIEGINQYGPTDAWFLLSTVALTNTSQMYFDESATGQPPRLYRLISIP